MEDPANPIQIVLWGGFFLALIFGYVANKTSFCTMGAVSDVVNMGHWGRMRAWLLAIAVAILGTSLLVYFGKLDVSRTIYTSGNFFWLAALVGGLTFGIGMTLASGCGQRTLVRLGGGNLKSVVVFLFLGYSALVTLRGLFGALRVNYLQHESVTIHFEGLQTLPSVMALAGFEPHVATLVIGAIIATSLMIFAFMDTEFRHSRDNVLAGIVVGLIVVGGWYVTGHLGFGENPDTLEETFFATNSKLAESMSFVAPLGYTMDLWAYWTDEQTTFTFGIVSVIGVVLGSFLCSIVHKSFHWESFASAQDMFRHIVGAILMGFGGVTALGCTIGQGVTGISTLALASFVTLAAIIAGSAALMKFEYYMMMRGN